LRLIFKMTINKTLMKKRKKTKKKMKSRLNGSLMKSSFLDKKKLNQIQVTRTKKSQVFLCCLLSFLVSLTKNRSDYIKKWVLLIMALSLLKINLLFLQGTKLQNFFAIKLMQIFFRKCSLNLKIYHSLHNFVKKCTLNFMKSLIFHN